MVRSIEPVGVICSSLDRYTNWKIYTGAPKVADGDGTFVTIALIGSTPSRTRGTAARTWTPG